MKTALSGDRNGARTHPEKNCFVTNNPSYKGMKSHTKGMHWYNNGEKEIMCKPENLPDGFIKGRLKCL